MEQAAEMKRMEAASGGDTDTGLVEKKNASGPVRSYDEMSQ